MACGITSRKGQVAARPAQHTKSGIPGREVCLFSSHGLENQTLDASWPSLGLHITRAAPPYFCTLPCYYSHTCDCITRENAAHAQAFCPPVNLSSWRKPSSYVREYKVLPPLLSIGHWVHVTAAVIKVIVRVDLRSARSVQQTSHSRGIGYLCPVQSPKLSRMISFARTKRAMANDLHEQAQVKHVLLRRVV